MRTSLDFTPETAKTSSLRMVGLPITISRACVLVALAVVFLLLGRTAGADPVGIVLNCNGTNYGPNGALISNCPTLGGTAGMASAGGTETAGLNYFLNTINMMGLNTTLGYTGTTGGNPPPPDFLNNLNSPVTSHPTWTATNVPVYLQLNGTVDFPGLYTPASISLDLVGTLQGTLSNWNQVNNGVGIATDCSTASQLCIDDVMTSAAFPQCIGQVCTISVPETASYAPPAADTAAETLSIMTTGGVIYHNDDVFAGTPEPGSIYLLGSGLLGMIGILRRKLRRV